MAIPSKVPHNRLVVAGRLLPNFSEFALTRDRLYEVGTAVLHTIDISDVLFLICVSFLTVPIVRIIHGVWFSDYYSKAKKAEGGESSDESDPFLSTYTFHVAESISQMAMIAMIVYCIDCLMIVVYLQGIEFALAGDLDVGSTCARILYTTWFGFRCMRFKRYLLGRVVNKSPEKLGKALVYDRILNWIIYAILAFSIMDSAQVEIGAGLKSVFALSGVGTLILSLASKDMATLFVSGLALSTSEKFRKGDLIKLGDNTTGVVERLGILFTEVRGGDEVITKIPNSQLANQRVSNLSRMQRSQVTQTLRFEYEDLPKMPELLESIKQEIQQACPNVITDGSRPFRANLNSFNADHIEVVVDTRHNLPPIGKVYFDNRQQVLEAIARAVAKHNVKFAIPEFQVINAPASVGGSS